VTSVESRNYKVAELIVEGGRIEAPKTPKGVECGEGVSPSPRGRSLGRKFFLNIAYKMLQFGAYS